MKKCDICDRRSICCNLYSNVFFRDTPLNIKLFCLECELSFYTQFLGWERKDITDYVRWSNEQERI